MVKLSLPTWDRDKSQLQAGTSFTPSIAGRLKSSTSSTSSVLRRFKSPDSTAPSQPTSHPLMVLRLSSPSFLDSVVHDGSSDNPLYVIDTDDNITKVRRSDPKGFVNVSRVRWPTDSQRSPSRKTKDLAGVEVVFGKGHWKPADDFLGYSYGSLSSYRKFYIPHHQHSLRWKRLGSNYACTTETVKGPVAILEPAVQRAPAQLKILDPLFRLGTSRPQRMHNGLPLSLLDFLLVTAMLLVTPTDEWMNVTRASPSESFPDLSNPSNGSLMGPQSTDTRPSSSSLSSETPDMEALLDTSEATPAIERWRSSIPARVMEDNQSRYAESIDGRASSTASRATSRLSFHGDTPSSNQHSTYPSGQAVYSSHSGSSLSIASHAFSSSQHPNRRTRELPMPPLPSSHGYSYSRGPGSASSHISHMSYAPHGRISQDEPPPLPPLPSSSSISPHDARSPVVSPISVPSRRVTASPTSSVHSRSLPIPPTPSTSKPQLPFQSLSQMPSPNSAVSPSPLFPLPGPVSPIPPHQPSLPHSRSYSHIRNPTATTYPESPQDYNSPTKAPPNYAASVHDLSPLSAPTSALPPVPVPVPVPTLTPAERAGASRSLSIRTTNVRPAISTSRGARSPSAGSIPTGFASAEVVDPYDLPPAYSALDMARSPLRLRMGNGEMGGGERQQRF
ncbi:hypothetical protein B0F90DRAFT_1671046 [Multifurca ochricompacta]|uniref:Uncharacterized protein n=1 Tax=Multifurca ochricompacta TaxID=376703 RepID=A0AAD4LW13_9AGAM|nr:hypothetical protein B0F90DRAFT_1671046 [Multifurca ochricompacta]